MCVCVRERERERECVCVCEREREWGGECVCVCVCVRERERERAHWQRALDGNTARVKVYVVFCFPLPVHYKNTAGNLVSDSVTFT